MFNFYILHFIFSILHWTFFLCLLVLCLGCQGTNQPTMIGQPDGPYRLELSVDPPQPRAGQPTSLTYRVVETKTQQPIPDLQVLHERVLHTFIVSRDLKTFAHTHHEDFFPLTAQDLAGATFHYPHVFPQGGDYFIASEFTYKDRSWIKQFTLPVAGVSPPLSSGKEDVRRDKSFGPYQIALRTSPDPPVVGHEVELVCHITRDETLVTNLGLYLGTEVHMAAWRLDGEHFGHQHTYTPEMAAMMEKMRDHTNNPHHMARMMVQMMRSPAKQVYKGPDVPVHHVFPAPGLYKLFFEFAPGGQVLVADFIVRVVEYDEGGDTTIHSIVSPQDSQPDPPS